MPGNLLVIKRGCRLKILKKFLFNLIDRVFLKEFTWTGKTAQKGVRKIPFKQFKRILDLLFTLVKTNDQHYPLDIFEENMKTGILKHAYKYVVRYYDGFFLMIIN